MEENQIQQPKTNTLAVVSLVFSFFVPLVGLIVGLIALSKINKNKEGGKGLAVAGIVISSVIILFQLFILTLLLVAAGSSNNSSSSSTSQTSQTQKTFKFNERSDKQETDIEVLPNEPAVLDGVKMTVTTVRYATSLGEFEDASTGKTYVVADVTLENNGDKTKPYNSYDFRMQTASGQVLDSTYSISIDDTLGSGDLVAGGKATGKVVFEVPVEDGHQYIIWKPGLESDRAVVQVK